MKTTNDTLEKKVPGSGRDIGEASVHGICVRQPVDVAHACFALDVHGELLLDSPFEQTEAGGHGLLLRKHNQEVEPRDVDELRRDVDVPAISLPGANDDVLQSEAVCAEHSPVKLMTGSCDARIPE